MNIQKNNNLSFTCFVLVLSWLIYIPILFNGIFELFNVHSMELNNIHIWVLNFTACGFILSGILRLAFWFAFNQTIFTCKGEQ